MLKSEKSDPKVLLACPINIVKDYCLGSWLDAIKNLTYSNYDIYLVDNSPNPEYHSKLRHKHHVKIDYINPGSDQEVRDLMAISMEKIRRRALDKDYDYLFILECDIFPPSEIIELLLAHNKDVVGTSYFTEHGSKTCLQLLQIWETDTNAFESFYMPWEEVMKFYDGKVNYAYANGNGCILIERNVLEKITFHIIPQEIGYPDGFFHKDLFMKGIENFVDTSIIPFHWNSRWSTIPNDLNHKLLLQSINKHREL
jgi:hypothetical protein